MAQILNYDNQDIDLNSLFTFGFEPLKFLISTIAKAQKDCLKRIENIENKVSLREKKIDELDKQLKKQENFMAMKFKTLSNTISNNPNSSNRQDAGSNNADNEDNLNQNVNSNQPTIQQSNQQTNQQPNQNQSESGSNYDININSDSINFNKIRIGTEDGNRKLLVKIFINYYYYLLFIIYYILFFPYFLTFLFF